MKVQVGPCPINKIVLCSADAGPKSQAEGPSEAAHFFTGATWVGTLRNTAKELGCKFVILSTAHGMVNPDDVIKPYDMHISQYKAQVTVKWQQTVPHVLGHHQYGLMVFYAGGCRREPYLDVLIPILRDLGVSLITFGKPNVYDIGKLGEFIRLIVKGTTINELASVLNYPDKLEFIPVFAIVQKSPC